MVDRQVRIDLTATDKASKVVDDLADSVEELERLDPEVEVTADTDQAERAIEDLGDEARELSRKDQELIFRGKMDDARGGLKALRDDLDTTEDQARRAEKAVDDIGRAQGPRLAGNTVADLTGPLGEASSAASDIGGVFDGLGDSAENAWLKMGGTEQGAAKVASALGGVGFAVSAGIALWTLYTSQQKKAEEQQKKLAEGARKLRDALEQGDIDTGADQLIEDYKGAYDAAKKLGVPVQEVTDVLLGQADTLPSVADEWAHYTEVVEKGAKGNDLAGQAKVRAAVLWLQEHDQVTDAAAAYERANGTLDEQISLHDSVARSIAKTTGQTKSLVTEEERAEKQTDRLKKSMDYLRGSLDMERALLTFGEDFQAAHDKAAGGIALTSEEILDLKQDILDVAEYANLNPVEVKSLMDRVTAGDYLGVKTDVEALAAANPPKIPTALRDPTDAEMRAYATRVANRIRDILGGILGGAPGYGGGATLPLSVPAGGGSTTTNVITQYVPRGNLLAEQRAARRLSGGLYHRNR